MRRFSWWHAMSTFTVVLVVSVLIARGGGPPATISSTSKTSAAEQSSDSDSSTAVIRSAVRLSPLRLKATVPQAALPEQQKKWLADNCLFGAPKVNTTELGPIIKIYREGYVLGHSSLSRIPFWVCEHSTAQKLEGPADRKNSKFQPDPLLSRQPRSELSDYAGSGYDRGHMAPAGDFKYSQPVMNESFYLSNMVPQYGITFNRGIWKQLEETVRHWVATREECWIITGPMFYDPLEEDPATADGLVNYETIGDDAVAVPTHLFKIVASKKDGRWEAIAFVFENRRYSKPYRLDLQRTTIRWIEDRTGLDFFPDASTNPSTAANWEKLETTKSGMWDDE
jgi:DNA/RNA endonuclease G (NUC1)